jgi:raffinose/stachyose/melibiose transport system permease protein
METELRNRKTIAILMLPALIVYLAVFLVPVISALYLSLCEWDGLQAPVFIGLENFTYMFTKDTTLLTAIRNSIFFVVFSLGTQQVLGVIMALILTSGNIKHHNLFKNVYYLPCVLSGTAVGLMFSFIFNPKGLLTSFLALFGVESPLWLMDISGWIPLPLWIIGIVATWQYVGSTMMLYYAGIQGISTELFESAYLDGASKIKAIRYITLPLLKPISKISITLCCIGSLKFFDLVYNMTSGGPDHQTEVLALHLYTRAFQYWQYGYGSAISIVLLVLCLIVTFVVDKSIRSESI